MATISSCAAGNRAPAGTVRFQGALTELAGSGSIMGTGAGTRTAGGAGSVAAPRSLAGSRALAGAAVNIAALPVAVGELDVAAVEDVPV
ncbi:MAG: hypothetical protein ACOC1U_03755, partial [Spirochaetota bacterium]